MFAMGIFGGALFLPTIEAMNIQVEFFCRPVCISKFWLLDWAWPCWAVCKFIMIFLKTAKQSSCCCSAGWEPGVVSMGMWVHSLALLSHVKIQHCHKLCHTSVMWVRSGLAMAVAVTTAAVPIQSFTWELPYATVGSVKKERINK